MSERTKTIQDPRRGNTPLLLAPDQAMILLKAHERLIELQKVDGLEIRSLEIIVDGNATGGMEFARVTADFVTWSKEDYYETAIEDVEDFAVSSGALPHGDRKIRKIPYAERSPITNAHRAMNVDRSVRSFVEKTGLEGEDVRTIGGDVICSVAHWVTQNGGTPEDVIKAVGYGYAAYMSENYDPIPETPMMEFDIKVSVSNHEAGIDFQLDNFVADMEIDAEINESFRNGATSATL